jgi:broad specificity phosphatase PhoE
MDFERAPDRQHAFRPARIHLVRHGRTVMNRQVRFRGRRDVPLDEVGTAEAWEAARNLASERITAVYTSPLDRAREVAEAIASVCGVERVVDLHDLVNLDYGEWEGLTKEECSAMHPEEFRLYAEDPANAACPGGEALADAADRIVAALRAMGAAHPGEAIAAVTHGAMVRLAVLRVQPERHDDWQFKLPTGAATVFDVAGDTVSLVSAPDRSRPDPVKAASGDAVAPGDYAGHAAAG